MSTVKQQFLTPVGRLVQGDPFEKQTKNMQGQPLMTQAGAPTQRYFIAVAFAKADPAFPALWALFDQEAKRSFPSLFNPQGQCTHPRFSWKLVDGDGTDDNGKPNSQKEGFAGHWVLKFSSSFPPRCFYQGRYAPHEQIQDPNVIRRGYFVRVSGTVEGNANPQKPGLYCNLGMVEFVAQGPEIVSGPDASAVFGGAPVASLPAGAVALPAGGAATTPAAMPGAPAAAVMPGAQAAMPGLSAPVAAAAPVAPVYVAPNAAFVAGPGAAAGMPTPGAMPVPPGAPVAPPAPPAEPTKTAAWPSGFSYAQMLAANWTDASLRANGYIV